MADMIHKVYYVKAGAPDEATRSVRVIASTDAVDGCDEVVIQDWDLARYEANPVVLYFHNFLAMKPEDTLPIGRGSDVAVVDSKLQATLTFVDAKANPLAELVWQGFLQKSINAVSVGFKSRNVLPETRDGKQVYVLSGNELLEISVAPIPMNQEAVAQRAKSLEIIRKLAEAGSKAIPITPPSAAPNEAPMKNRAKTAAASTVTTTDDPTKAKTKADGATDSPDAAASGDAGSTAAATTDDGASDYCPAALRLVLGLPEDADDAAILADVETKIANLQAIHQLLSGDGEGSGSDDETQAGMPPSTDDPNAAKAVKSILALTNVASIEKAVGVIAAWKATAETVPQLETRRERDDLIRKGIADKKVTPAQKSWLETQPLETVKSFLEKAPVIPALKGLDVKQPMGAKKGADDPVLEIDGKRWEDLKPMQKHRLLQSNPELYESLKADFEARKRAK